MISMAIGTLFLPFLPLAAAQILLNSFLSDIPSPAVAGDRGREARLLPPQGLKARPPRTPRPELPGPGVPDQILCTLWRCGISMRLPCGARPSTRASSTAAAGSP